MSTWRPPWSAQGQFKLTLLPPTRASNSVTARRPPGPESTAALRAGSRDPDTRDLPADLGWPGGCQPGPSRHAINTPHPGPENHELEGDDALMRSTHGPGRPRSSASAPPTARGSRGQLEGLPDIGSPQARGTVDTRDCGSAARTPRQRTRSTASSGTVRAPAAIPRCRLGLGARGARPASARTHEPGRIVAHESIGVDCPRGGRRLWPG